MKAFQAGLLLLAGVLVGPARAEQALPKVESADFATKPMALANGIHGCVCDQVRPVP